MNFKQYAVAAARTFNPKMNAPKTITHAICGLVSETFEYYDAATNDEAILEMGDCVWMIAELCSVFDFSLEKIYADAQKIKATDNRVQFDLCGIAAMMCGCIQKMYQGHNTRANLKNLVTSYLCVAASEAEAILGANIAVVLDKNIEKLENRYPEGFSAERSVNRDE